MAATMAHLRVGFYASIVTAAATVVALGLALIAIPIAGANCLGECIGYPYLDTVAQFPRDYMWLVPAMVMVAAYLVLMVALEAYAAPERRIFGRIGLSIALITATLLLIDYFIQLFVIPVSLRNGETEGITILTMYNPHGVFIVLEELGYLLMSLSFAFAAPIFAAHNRLQSAVRWVFAAAFALTILAFAFYSLRFGLDRQDRFEVAAITVNWLALIVNGVLLSLVFRRQLATASGTSTSPG